MGVNHLDRIHRESFIHLGGKWRGLRTSHAHLITRKMSAALTPSLRICGWGVGGWEGGEEGGWGGGRGWGGGTVARRVAREQCGRGRAPARWLVAVAEQLGQGIPRAKGTPQDTERCLGTAWERALGAAWARVREPPGHCRGTPGHCRGTPGHCRGTPGHCQSN